MGNRFVRNDAHQWGQRYYYDKGGAANTNGGVGGADSSDGANSDTNNKGDHNRNAPGHGHH